MQTKDRINNFKEEFKIHAIRFAYLYAPIVGLVFYFSLTKYYKISLPTDFISNMINVSGVLAGFLFTTLGIIISLPSNKFMEYLNSTGYTGIIYNTMIIGITTLLSSMVTGIFDINVTIAKLLFLIGISETFLSAYYLHKISYFSRKSR